MASYNFLEPFASVHDVLELGPSRIPVIIDLAEYSRYCKTSAQPVTLFQFLGHQSGVPTSPELPAAIWNDYFSLQMCRGNAFVLMHGVLDSDELRDRVQTFVNELPLLAPSKSTRPSPRGIMSSLSSLSFLEEHQTYVTGGNQVLFMTSAVGYYLHPLQGAQINHFTLETLNKDAVVALCNPSALVARGFEPKQPLASAASARLLDKSLFPFSKEISLLPVLLVRLLDLQSP